MNWTFDYNLCTEFSLYDLVVSRIFFPLCFSVSVDYSLPVPSVRSDNIRVRSIQEPTFSLRHRFLFNSSLFVYLRIIVHIIVHIRIFSIGLFFIKSFSTETEGRLYGRNCYLSCKNLSTVHFPFPGTQRFPLLNTLPFITVDLRPVIPNKYIYENHG